MENQSVLPKTALGTVLFALVLNYVGIGLVFSLFPQLCFDTSIGFLPLNTSATERNMILGVLLCLMPMTQFFFSPLLGMLSDRMGRKPLLVRSLFVGCLGYCLGAYAIITKCLSLLFISRVVVGVSTSNSSVIAASLADLSPKEKRSFCFSLYCMAVGCGLALGPFLGALLSQKGLSWTSYSLPFLAAGSLTLLNLVSILFYFPKYEQKIESTQAYISPIKLIVHSFLEKKLRLFFLMSFAFYFGWTFFWEFVPVTLMHTIAYKSEEIGLIYCVGAFSYTIASLFITNRLVSTMDRRLLVPFSLLSVALLIGALVFVKTKPALFGCIVLQQFFTSCIFPLLTSYASENAPETEQGKAIGMLLAVKAVACSLGPLCSGLFFSLSALTPVIVGSTSLLLAFGLSVYFFRRSTLEWTEDAVKPEGL